MKSYTVIYVESRMVGSHRVQVTKKAVIQGNNYDLAIENSTIDPWDVVFAFHGECQNVLAGE